MKIATLLIMISLPLLTMAQDAQSVPADRIQQRLEIARQYLIAAGLNAPSTLDTAHVAEVRAQLRAWIALQSTVSEETSPQSAVPPGIKPVKGYSIPANFFQTIYPTKPDRLARLVQFKSEMQEQIKTILVQNPITKAATPTLNPDRILRKYSLSLQFSELYPLAADLSSMYEGAQKSGLKLPASAAPGPCMKTDFSPDIPCLRRIRARDIFGRGVAGVTLTLSRSGNPRFVQNVLIPETTFEAGLEHSYSGEINFDPAKLFPTSGDWASAKTAVDAMVKIKPDKPSSDTSSPNDLLSTELQRICGQQREIDSHCLRRLAGPTGKWALISALVPTFNFKVQSQFDFIKNSGGSFVSPPFPENHLWNMTFTTDLRKAVTPFNARAQALAQMQSLIENHDALISACKSVRLPRVNAGSLFYYSLPKGTTVKWSIDTDRQACDARKEEDKRDCQIDGIALKDGLLVGYPDMAGSIPLALVVKDSAGNPLACPKDLVVTGGNDLRAFDELVLNYLELSISPEVVVDEEWFEKFRSTVRATLFATPHDSARLLITQSH